MSIELGFVKNIFTKHFKKISNLIVEHLKDGWEKFKIDSDIAFTQYLNKSFDKYSRIKTILYRTEPKYIYNFFEFPKIVKETCAFPSSSHFDRSVFKKPDTTKVIFFDGFPKGNAMINT